MQWQLGYEVKEILTLSHQTTYIYIYICRAVSPLNSRTATKVARDGGI